MAAEAFIIRELTGSQREVQLIGRTLPYRPVEFAGTQHYVQRWYPGNRRATLQVLGAREQETEIRGTWKDRFMLGNVRMTGFPDLLDAQNNTTAEGLAEAFQRLRIAGNTIEVRWGPEVRVGILAGFTPNYQRVEDIEWTARFVWSELGERRAPRAAETPPTSEDIQDVMNALDDTLADDPTDAQPEEVSRISALGSALRVGISAITKGLAEVQTTANAATARLQQIQSATKVVIDAGRGLKNGTLDLPYVDLLPTDDVKSILSAEVWKRQLGFETGQAQADTIKARDGVEDDAVPGVLAVVTVRENQTLRTLALDYYGNADSWTTIADANGITGSQVAAGTVVEIPRPPTTGAGVQVRL
jgi:hypothetical protein